MGLAVLGDLPMRIDPLSVKWDFRMSVRDRKTLDGKVVQVLGTTLGDMTVTGVFGFGDRSKGDEAGWEEQERWRQAVKTLTRTTSLDRTPDPIRFLYPPKKWDFHVYVTRVNEPVRHANEVFNPTWGLTLFIVRDNTNVVVKGIRDLYIQRLMAGIGWKQTSYNGPLTQEDVDTFLSGQGVTSTGRAGIDEYLLKDQQKALGIAP